MRRPAHVEETDAIAARMEEATEANDVESCCWLTIEFHMSIIEMSDSQKGMQFWPMLEDSLPVYRSGGWVVSASRRASNYDHCATVRALCEGDVQGSGRLPSSMCSEGNARLPRAAD
jgi:DNA-binding GntR family transcriptional regulator